MSEAPKILWYDDQECSAGPVKFGDGEVKYVRADLVDVTEPARKPMTHEEITQGVTVDTSDDFHAGYWAGIRRAEKHHGIGRGME